MRITTILLLLLLSSVVVYSATSETDLKEKIASYMRKVFNMPPTVMLSVGDIKASEIAELNKAVVTASIGEKKQVQEVYISKNGEYLLIGKVFTLDSSAFIGSVGGESIGTMKQVKIRQKAKENETEIEPWLQAGFTSKEAKQWMDAGITEDDAIQQKQAGFTINEAKEMRNKIRHFVEEYFYPIGEIQNFKILKIQRVPSLVPTFDVVCSFDVFLTDISPEALDEFADRIGQGRDIADNPATKFLKWVCHSLSKDESCHVKKFIFVIRRGYNKWEFSNVYFE